MGVRKLFLLDTNIVSEPTKTSPNTKVLSNLNTQGPFSVICAPVWYELLKGVYTMPAGKRRDGIEDFALNYIQSFYPVLPYDVHCAALQADIYARMQKNGTPVSQLDMQIAATALANNLIVVTRNTKDFEPIQKEFSLCVENWFL